VISANKKLTFDIAIPVLNEEVHLKEQITRLVEYYNSNLNNAYNAIFTVTIADNGSTDKTQAIAKELANKYYGTVC